MKDNGNFPFLANQTGKFSSLWHHGKHSYITFSENVLYGGNQVIKQAWLLFLPERKWRILISINRNYSAILAILQITSYALGV
jgi:hypothetical protein